MFNLGGSYGVMYHLLALFAQRLRLFGSSGCVIWTVEWNDFKKIAASHKVHIICYRFELEFPKWFESDRRVLRISTTCFALFFRMFWKYIFRKYFITDKMFLYLRFGTD